MSSPKLILGIESTCDEMGFALVLDGKKILSNTIYSQAKLHAPHGGVVPEIACRKHIEVMIPLLDQSLKEASISLQEIEGIAVANRPGLIGALLIGLNCAKSLAFTLNKPLLGIDHVQAHIYAAIMESSIPPSFPSLGIVLSGGHTLLLKMNAIDDYIILGTTIDDAIGEAFDKVASMLGLPYPGGAPIEDLARTGNPQAFAFKGGHVKNNPFNFSFSGLKTKVLYTIKGKNVKKDAPLQIKEEDKKHVAAAFQEAAFNDVIDKALLAAQHIDAKALYIGGGVSQNKTLRDKLATACPLPIFWPSPPLCMDNAAMIAGLAYHKFKRQTQGDGLELQAYNFSDLPIN